MGPVALRRRVPAGADQRRRPRALDSEPADLLARRGSGPAATQPVPRQRVRRRGLRDLLSRWFARIDVYALAHGARIHEWGAHGSLVQALLAAPPAEWSAPIADLVGAASRQRLPGHRPHRAATRPARSRARTAMTRATEPVGTCCIVLHTHLPWLAHHGSWPVGEEWLYQAWAASYLPLVEMLDRLAAEGRRDLLSLGMTPVLAAQLDDPYCLREFHTWLGFWQTRAEGLAGERDPALRELGRHEFRAATSASRLFEWRWRHGASPLLCGLVDSGTVELLGGPATHPFLPLLHERIARFALRCGSRRCSAAHRLATNRDLGAGVRLPPGSGADVRRRRCAALPGRRADDARHRPADQPAWTVGVSDVVAFAPRPGGDGPGLVAAGGVSRRPGYRDFHTFDHPSGLRPAGHVPPHATGAQGAVRPGTRADGGGCRCRGTSSAWSGPGWTRTGTVRRRRTGRGRVGHRAVRSLVARGPGVPRARAADAARSRGAGRDAGGAVEAGHVAGASTSARARGVRARTGGCGTAAGSPTSSRTASACRSGCSTSYDGDATRVAATRRSIRPARRCSCWPATGRSWCGGTQPPGTPAPGTRASARIRPARAQHRAREPARPGAGQPLDRPFGHLDARLLMVDAS